MQRMRMQRQCNRRVLLSGMMIAPLEPPLRSTKNNFWHCPQTKKMANLAFFPLFPINLVKNSLGSLTEALRIFLINLVGHLILAA